MNRKIFIQKMLEQQERYTMISIFLPLIFGYFDLSRNEVNSLFQITSSNPREFKFGVKDHMILSCISECAHNILYVSGAEEEALLKLLKIKTIKELTEITLEALVTCINYGHLGSVKVLEDYLPTHYNKFIENSDQLSTNLLKAKLYLKHNPIYAAQQIQTALVMDYKQPPSELGKAYLKARFSHVLSSERSIQPRKLKAQPTSEEKSLLTKKVLYKEEVSLSSGIFSIFYRCMPGYSQKQNTQETEDAILKKLLKRLPYLLYRAVIGVDKNFKEDLKRYIRAYEEMSVSSEHDEKNTSEKI